MNDSRKCLAELGEALFDPSSQNLSTKPGQVKLADDVYDKLFCDLAKEMFALRAWFVRILHRVNDGLNPLANDRC